MTVPSSVVVVVVVESIALYRDERCVCVCDSGL